MNQTPQAGGSYRRDKNGTLTPIGAATTEQAPATPEPTPTRGETALVEPAPKKGK